MSGALSEIPPMVIGGSIISAVSLILHIIGFSTTYWYLEKKDGGTIAHIGLWKYCAPAEGGLVEMCVDMTDAPSYNSQYKAAQALECLALLAFVAAVVCAFLKVFVLKEKRMMFVVTGFLNLISGITALIGVIVFATFSYDDFKFDGSMFHYSFGLCIVGGIGGIFSGIVFILAWRWVRN
ncbi:lens fiber membrane intrinsic protein-like [Mytilus edulis]|uniref:lens fiber membrane intrinsic protein-like n=1 Tax=Mytilus edulis TaxID=6550 RepID=UPI0039F13EA5